MVDTGNEVGASAGLYGADVDVSQGTVVVGAPVVW